MKILRLAVALAFATFTGCNCAPPAVVTPDAGPTCTPDVTCTTNPGAPCKGGKTSCATGVSACVDSASAMAGLTCGGGRVCDGAGACVACNQGASCAMNPSAPCRLGTLDCSGAPACVDGANAAAGLSCGVDRVCTGGGACAACASGQSCAANPGAPCFTGVTSCATGALVCEDATAVGAGTACGTDQVCTSAGQCVACAAGVACTTNPGAPCTAGVSSCSTGALACVDGARLGAGTACGSNLVCNASGACVSCAAGSACTTNPGGTCVAGVLACSSGAPACNDGATLPAGQTCGVDQVCTVDGDCVTCAADAGCQPGANECEGGATECSTGLSTCVSRGPLPDGAACSGGSCLRGGCEPAATVSGLVNLSTDTLVPSRAPCPDAPASGVNALTATTADLATMPTCLAPGDEVLLINQQGGTSAVSNVGAWETLTVDQISGTLVTFTGAKTRFYGTGAADDLDVGPAPGQQHVALVRIPHFGDLTVTDGGTLTVDAWNGTTGGILALRAGALTVDGTISVRGKGYRDGRWSVDGPCSTSVTTEQGESIAGPLQQTTAPNFGGSGGIGAAGGDSFNGNTPITSSAGHSSVGQAGVNAHTRTLGSPGGVYGSATGALLTMGSGVGGNLSCVGGGGGPALSGTLASNAGGAIFIGAGSIVLSGTARVVADAQPPGRDGAPSAGSVMLRARTMSLGTDRVTAIGATAVSGSPPTAGAVIKGSDGYVWLFYESALSGTTTPAAFTSQLPNP